MGGFQAPILSLANHFLSLGVHVVRSKRKYLCNVWHTNRSASSHCTVGQPLHARHSTHMCSVSRMCSPPRPGVDIRPHVTSPSMRQHLPMGPRSVLRASSQLGLKGFPITCTFMPEVPLIVAFMVMLAWCGRRWGNVGATSRHRSGLVLACEPPGELRCPAKCSVMAGARRSV
jgi:hypothetical protein